jgi:hypothetical protein
MRSVASANRFKCRRRVQANGQICSAGKDANFRNEATITGDRGCRPPEGVVALIKHFGRSSIVDHHEALSQKRE